MKFTGPKSVAEDIIKNYINAAECHQIISPNGRRRETSDWLIFKYFEDEDISYDELLSYSFHLIDAVIDSTECQNRAANYPYAKVNRNLENALRVILETIAAELSVDDLLKVLPSASKSLDDSIYDSSDICDAFLIQFMEGEQSEMFPQLCELLSEYGSSDNSSVYRAHLHLFLLAASRLDVVTEASIAEITNSDKETKAEMIKDFDVTGYCSDDFCDGIIIALSYANLGE